MYAVVDAARSAKRPDMHDGSRGWVAHEMRVTDRPGRYLALMVVSPLLVVAGVLVIGCQPAVAAQLFVFACALFFYELFWICNSVGFEVATVPFTKPACAAASLPDPRADPYVDRAPGPTLCTPFPHSTARPPCPCCGTRQ